ncbi:MAG: UvrD-helicase domain-containing protein [Mycobacteriales bacterium]
MTTRLTDQAVRDRITNDTSATLFVNAGAGSGKTSALVDRVTALVLRDHVRLQNIAAVTFTEKAGAELRDLLRARFEAAQREERRGDGVPSAPDASLANRALDDLDGAAVGTLHSFAQRILTEHPIEAGLPPIIDVLDEVGSSVAFEQRWSELQRELLDDDAIATPVLLGLALGMQLTQVRSLAILLGKDWDLIGDRVLVGPAPTLAHPDITAFLDHATRVVALHDLCTDPSDRLLEPFGRLAELVTLLAAAPDLETQLQVLSDIGLIKFSYGRKGNWQRPVDEVRTAANQLLEDGRAHIAGVLDQCLRLITRWLAERVLDAAERRRRDGQLEFHDLLVLARNLLRRDNDVRAALHEDYQRILLDEFQDTDPIQIELAARICGGAGADAEEWPDIEIPPGRLFVVGDAKQSIYRFRRASMQTYLEAERCIGESVGLTSNFRTVPPILRWVNSVFGQLIQPVEDGQPNYVPLSPVRDSTGTGAPVTVLGAPAHTDLPRAAASTLREREAADVAAAIREALDREWQVFDERSGTWRAARSSDIAVLVPARTSLRFLEEALDAARIDYRAEASSLVYQASEVRDLLAGARAIADTSDGLSLVTALRSQLFGCGDDDLWR